MCQFWRWIGFRIQLQNCSIGYGSYQIDKFEKETEQCWIPIQFRTTSVLQYVDLSWKPSLWNIVFVQRRLEVQLIDENINQLLSEPIWSELSAQNVWKCGCRSGQQSRSQFRLHHKQPWIQICNGVDTRVGQKKSIEVVEELDKWV